MHTSSLYRLTSLVLSGIAFLFVSQQISWLSVLRLPTDNTPFYIALILVAGFGSLLVFRSTDRKPFLLVGNILHFFLPLTLFFAFGFALSKNFHFLVPLWIGLYTILAFAYWTARLLKQESLGQIAPTAPSWSLKQTYTRHGWFPLAGVLCATLLFFFFGLFHLTQFVAVDEPLWMDGRINRFFTNVAERDFAKTDISDKPGITLVLASGPGLWFVTPKDYRDARFIFNAKKENLDIEDMYLAFRLPLLIVITLLLPFFYFLLVPLLGSTIALFSYLSIALSPVLIGMSKIVNPDALLWVFAPLSLLAYLVYLEKKTFRTLLLSGVFLGLALLTKYVANFLIVFLFGYIFLRFLTDKKSALPFPEYSKQSFLAFLIWLGTGLATLYLLLPALWLEPTKIFTSTIFSQAFEKVASLFLVFVALIFIDQRFFQSRFGSTLMAYGRRFSHFLHFGTLCLFVSISVFVIGNSLFNMRWIDFMEILASPKSIYQMSDHIMLFLTNFYPLLLGVPALILIGTLVALFRKRIDDTVSQLILTLVTFMLLYSFASTINQVVLINRYQIMLYPLMGILSGIGIVMILTFLRTRIAWLRRWEGWYPVTFGLLMTAFVTLLIITPFPLSFSNILLPKAYTTDIKDMGSGSYEAAQYLNSLPNAKELAIWTDKRGVCKIFVGTCIDGFNFSNLPTTGIDYVVISAGRESRTDRMMSAAYRLDDPGFVRFDSYYQRDNPVWELFINDRRAQFVKIFPFESTP